MSMAARLARFGSSGYLKVGWREEGTAMAKWNWSVSGTEMSLGTVERSYDAEGVVEAELAGEVLDWLTNGDRAGIESITESSPIWDSIDTDYPFTITISPAQ